MGTTHFSIFFVCAREIFIFSHLRKLEVFIFRSILALNFVLQKGQALFYYLRRSRQVLELCKLSLLGWLLLWGGE